MSFYPDLGTRCDGGWGPAVRAVGWLSADQPYITGPVSAEFLSALRAHLREPWQPFFYGGFHTCELCLAQRPWRWLHRLPGGRLQRTAWRWMVKRTPGVCGGHNLYIPTPECVYIAPEMVWHYIELHTYRPPDEFIGALLGCPPQGSPAFDALIRPFRSRAQIGEFDRDWRAREAERNAQAGRWLWKGMCGACGQWLYAYNDRDEQRHCGEPLVRVIFRQ